MPAIPYITYIAQVALEFINDTLLVKNGRFSPCSLSTYWILLKPDFVRHKFVVAIVVAVVVAAALFLALL